MSQATADVISDVRSHYDVPDGDQAARVEDTGWYRAGLKILLLPFLLFDLLHAPHGWAQIGISRFGPTTRITQRAYNWDLRFMRVDLKWLNFNSERMEMLILRCQPSHKAEILLFWKFGVSAFCLCRVILKTSSVTKRLQCLCWMALTTRALPQT